MLFYLNNQRGRKKNLLSGVCVIVDDLHGDNYVWEPGSLFFFFFFLVHFRLGNYIMPDPTKGIDGITGSVFLFFLSLPTSVPFRRL